MANTKRCSRCGLDKQFSEFGKNRTRKDGMQAYCKQCAREAVRDWRSDNPDHITLPDEPRRILSLYDVSGAWSQPYAAAGYIVHRVDKLVGSDVRTMEAPRVPIHGILAAPPCTVFSIAGNRWDRTNEELLDGLSTVDAVLRLVTVCKPTWWCLENPAGKLKHYLGEPVHRFDPCDYGDPWKKRTCLWGEFKTPTPTPVEATDGSLVDNLGSMHSYARSLTPPGFAKAFFAANP